MSDRIHDDEPDTGEAVVRALLGAECPRWSSADLTRLANSGTDNAMWRVCVDEAPDVVVRLPRRPGAAAGVEREVAALEAIAASPVSDLVATPVVRHLGSPSDVFPHRWSVLEWITGIDAWECRADVVGLTEIELAERLASLVLAIREVPEAGLRERRAGERGGPLGPLLDSLDRWLHLAERDTPDLVDVPAVRRIADEARDLGAESVAPACVHGDLIPGNLILRSGVLSAVIDWGGVGRGDPAQDLAPAWAVLASAGREVFRSSLDIDDAAWIRGRTFELEHAIGGIVYYVPRGHPLGDVMTRTLERLLAPA